MNIRQMTIRKQEQLMSSMRSKDIEARFKEKRRIIIQNYQPLLLREDLEDLLKGKIAELQEAYSVLSQENAYKFMEIFNDIKSYISDHEMFHVVSLTVLKYEFLDFCLFILGPEFNHEKVKDLQYSSIFVLVNFIALMRKENPIYISTYIPFLNMKCGEIVKNLQRILQLNHRDDNVVQACYKLIGNILSEQSCCYDQVQQQIGILSLLTYPGHEQLKVWILQIVLQNGEMLNDKEVEAAFPILELMLNSPRKSDDYFNALYTITTLSHKMIGLKDQFQKIKFKYTFLRDANDEVVLKNYQELIIRLIIGLLRQEYLQEDRFLVEKSIELVCIAMSSEKQRCLDSGLWALEKLAEKYDDELLEYDPYIPEKLIALGTSHNNYIVERAMFAIYTFLQKQARQIFLNNNLFRLLSDNLIGLGESVTKISLSVLLAILQKAIEYEYDMSVPGNTEQKAYTQMLNQLKRSGIADRIYQLECEQMQNQEITKLLDDVSQLVIYMMDCVEQ